MTEIEEIEARVRDLPSEDFARFRDWFHEFENELWDRQIESDYRAGKLDALINKARAELAQGKAREIRSTAHRASFGRYIGNFRRTFEG